MTATASALAAPGSAPGRLVVTGGSGLIGRPVVAEFAAAGWEPVVLSRRPERVRGLPAGARAVGWDGRTAAGWAPEVDGAAGIVHLAGEGIADGRWTAAKKRRIRDSRIESSGAVAEAVAAAAVKPRFLLQGSAVGFYGATGDEPVGEDHGPGAGFLPETCLAWEEATAAVEALGVRRAVLRTGVVLARDGGALPKMALPFRFGIGGRFGTGRQFMPWIHLADEVAAIRFLAEHPAASGPFNLTAPAPATNAELSAEIARALRRPNLLWVPALSLRVAVGEMAETLLTGQRALPRRLLELGFRFRFPNLGGALADLLG